MEQPQSSEDRRRRGIHAAPWCLVFDGVAAVLVVAGMLYLAASPGDGASEAVASHLEATRQ